MRDGLRCSGRRTKGRARQRVSRPTPGASSPSIPVWLSIALHCRSGHCSGSHCCQPRRVGWAMAVLVSGQQTRPGRPRPAGQLSAAAAACLSTAHLAISVCCTVLLPLRDGTRRRAARVLLCAAARDVCRLTIRPAIRQRTMGGRARAAHSKKKQRKKAAENQSVRFHGFDGVALPHTETGSELHSRTATSNSIGTLGSPAVRLASLAAPSQPSASATRFTRCRRVVHPLLLLLLLWSPLPRSLTHCAYVWHVLQSASLSLIHPPHPAPSSRSLLFLSSSPPTAVRPPSSWRLVPPSCTRCCSACWAQWHSASRGAWCCSGSSRFEFVRLDCASTAAVAGGRRAALHQMSSQFAHSSAWWSWRSDGRL